MAYEIKKGILHKDGVAKIALGASYYPSFHKAKFQVPPEDDRIGEMEKDLKLMQDCGFNFLRTAAIGELGLDENGEVSVQTDFIDAMALECEKRDIACSVRLNGYVTNLSGNTDYEMRNHRGEPLEKKWSVFLEFCLHHKGILKDNEKVTKALAAHFAKFNSMVSYQIYNEPHYPGNGRFDYHPMAIEAYRKYAVAQGYMTEAEAENYMPPTENPVCKEELPEWNRWNLFAMQSMSDFLNATANAAKQQTPHLGTYTCFTSAETANKRVGHGVSYFGDTMDILGLTSYANFVGSDMYTGTCVLDICACAAELDNKPAWLIEADARMKMPARKLFAQSYIALGAGFKGLCYYEWRGDYPYEGTPLPDNCGFLHYDGTKGLAFDEKMKLMPIINKYSTELALAKRTHNGVAILHSDYGCSTGEALANLDAGGINVWQKESIVIYTQLMRKKLQVDFMRAEHLAENQFSVKVLFVPMLDFLSEEERALVEAFVQNGGEVYYTDHRVSFGTINTFGYINSKKPKKNETCDEFEGAWEIDDIVEMHDLTPMVQTNNRHLFAKVIEGEDYYFVTVCNNSMHYKKFINQKLDIALPFKAARLITPEGEMELHVENGSVVIPEIDYSFLLRLKK
ncbi:MAG: beta-galactosidase [Clostridia bacterium]|nr:beta-galactosidase [Clostridia bacterium]